MLKHSSSLISYILSRIEIINPTGVSKEEMIKEIKKEFREEMEQSKERIQGR